VDAGDQVQQCRLARSRRPHQGHEVALVHLEAEPVQDRHLLGVPAVDLPHVPHIDHDHGPAPCRALARLRRRFRRRRHHPRPFTRTASPSLRVSGGREITPSPPESPFRIPTCPCRSVPVVTSWACALPSRTRKTSVFPSRETTAAWGTTTTGVAEGAAYAFFSRSRNVTLALISGFRSSSFSRIVPFTITVALVRSA